MKYRRIEEKRSGKYEETKRKKYNQTRYEEHKKDTYTKSMMPKNLQKKLSNRTNCHNTIIIQVSAIRQTKTNELVSVIDCQ